MQSAGRRHRAGERGGGTQPRKILAGNRRRGRLVVLAKARTCGCRGKLARKILAGYRLSLSPRPSGERGRLRLARRRRLLARKILALCRRGGLPLRLEAELRLTVRLPGLQ